MRSRPRLARMRAGIVCSAHASTSTCQPACSNDTNRPALSCDASCQGKAGEGVPRIQCESTTTGTDQPSSRCMRTSGLVPATRSPAASTMAKECSWPWIHLIGALSLPPDERRRRATGTTPHADLALHPKDQILHPLIRYWRAPGTAGQDDHHEAHQPRVGRSGERLHNAMMFVHVGFEPFGPH